MEIQKTINDGIITIKIIGRLDTSNSTQLDEEVKELKEDDKLILDFSELEYLSSVGLRILLSLKKKLKDNIKIINVNEFVREVFDMTGFSDIFEIK